MSGDSYVESHRLCAFLTDINIDVAGEVRRGGIDGDQYRAVIQLPEAELYTHEIPAFVEALARLAEDTDALRRDLQLRWEGE